MCIAKIERIRFFYRDGLAGKNVECPQDIAEDYQLVLRPMKSTGDITWIKPDGSEYRSWRDGEMPPGTEAKLKTIQHVKNVVLLAYA